MPVMSDAAWQQTLSLARRYGLADAEIAGLAIGCPRHGNAHMDFETPAGAPAEVFCHECERNAEFAADNDSPYAYGTGVYGAVRS